MMKHESKNCRRCGDDFECKSGSVSECQCFDVNLTAKEQQYISEKYNDCLCAKCLEEMKKEYMRKNFRQEQLGLSYRAAKQRI